MKMRTRTGPFDPFAVAAACLLAAVFAALTPAPAGALELPPTEPLFVIDTPGFSVHYPAALEAQALRLAGFADAERARLEALFGLSFGRRRIPVLLSDSSPWLNGYQTNAPSERLVIQLAPAPYSGELSSMRDELRDVFTHELTHALTSGLRGPLWSALAFLFGDPVEPVAWMIPAVISEGTSVLAESSRGEGRLNDPAAAARMRIDTGRRVGREFWDANGASPYAGSLYHLYGGPFADYLLRRFGPDVIARLWIEGSKGNLLAGFDGSFFPGGIFRAVTGAYLEDVWRDFLDSIRLPDISADMARAAAVPGSGRLVTATAARGGILYWVDAEAGAAFAIDLASMPDLASVPVGAAPRARPERLFAADGAIGDIAVSADGARLLVEWVRQETGGRLAAVVREFDLASRCFVAEYPAPGSLASASGADDEPRLARASRVPERNADYGLVRIGARLFAARRSGGELEVLDSGGFGTDSAGGTAAGLGAIMAVSASRDRVAIMHTGDNGVPRIALFTEAASGGAEPGTGALVPYGDIPGTMGAFWQMALVDSAPSAIAFTRLEPDGGQHLMLAPIAPIAPIAPTGPTPTHRFDWIPWRAVSEAPVTGTPVTEAPATEPDSSGSRHVRARRSFLPLAGRTYRVPSWENDTLSIGFSGKDLTGFLSWQAKAGWDFAGGGPEASIALEADFGRHELGVALSDRLGSTPLGTWKRSSIGVLSFSGIRQSRPLYRWWGYGADAALALSGAAASASSGQAAWTAARDHAAAGTSIWTGYSTMRASYFEPYDASGWSLFGGAELEWASWALPGAAPGAGAALPTDAPLLSLSASGHAAARPLGLDARLSGALSLSPSLRFTPAYRVTTASGGTGYSILGSAWPAMAEYSADTGLSPWLAYAEISARAYLLQALPHAPRPRGVRLPFRFMSLVLRPGLRAAMYQPGAAGLDLHDPAPLALPASAFLRATAKFAPLAGLSAQASFILAAEAAWILDPDRAGGNHIAFSFGSSVGLP